MSEDATLDEFVDAEREDATESVKDTDTLDQEKFGPFTLSTPGEWSAKRLGDIKKLITRGKQPTYDDDGIPVINQECIYWDGWHFENLRYLDEDVGGDWKNKYFPQKGDVILNSTGQGTLGRAQVYPDNQRRAIDSHVTLLRTEDELNPYFHRYFLESHLGQALLYSMCVNGSTGQIELSKTRLDLQPVPLPPLAEQRKIATVLYTVDKAIEKTEEIIEQKERIQTGLMQDIFTGVNVDSTKSVRLSAVDTEIPEHWKVKEVGEVSTQITDGAHLTPDRSEDGYLLLSARNVKNGYLDLSDVDYVPEEEYERLIEKCDPQPGDILISCSGTVGRVCEVPEDLEFALVRSAALVKFDDSLLPSYAEKVLQSVGVQKQIMGYQTQSAQPNLFQGQIASLEIPIPPVEEQRDIANKLDDIGASVNSDQRYKSQLERLKHGLMQDLLSGTVRTTATNIQVPDEIAQHG